MTRRSSATNARLIYTGVALASGGIAFYVPLMLSSVGLAHSGQARRYVAASAVNLTRQW